MTDLTRSLLAYVPHGTPALTPVTTKNPLITAAQHQRQTYLTAAMAPNTRTAYRSDIIHFMRAGGILPTPPAGVLQYLHQFADQLNPRTLQRRLTAIKHWHTYQGFPDPTAHPLIHQTLTGIYKTHGQPVAKAPALTVPHLTQLVHYLQSQHQLVAWRDNALLQLGFFGAFRRSELVALRWEQVSFVNKGIEVLIVRSKTDPRGTGQVCAIPHGNHPILCPVRALREWQAHAHLTTGPLFRRITAANQLGEHPLSPASLNHLIKRHAIACQLPNAHAYSGHSLRRGFATAAAQSGASLGSIMRQGRWRHAGTVQGYIAEGERFEDNAAAHVLAKETKG